MLNENSYYWFNSALSPEICSKIIELGLSKNLEKAVTNGNTEIQNDQQVSVGELSKQEQKKLNLKENQKYERDSKVSWLDEPWLYELIIPYIQSANHRAGWNYEFDVTEQFQFTVYNADKETGKKGFYGWHADGGGCHFSTYNRYIPGLSLPLKENGDLPSKYTQNEEMVGKVRKLSLTINLNNSSEYTGGNLKFDFGPHTDGERFVECTENRDQGSMIIFPSYTYHCVTPVTSGTRYSLVLWCLGKPFK
jgi:PKHD-type hydroxylase